jgi:hypothetical protein
MEVWEWISWNLWSRWRYRWKHRHDTLDEARAEMYKQWENTLDAFKDEPAGRELHDAVDGMEEIKKAFGDRKE